MSAYRGARFFSISGIVTGQYFAWQGVVAGDSFATTFVRVYAIPTVDLLPMHVRDALDIYIDDYGLQAIGTARSVVEDIVSGATQLHSVLSGDMQVVVSEDKASVVCSDKVVGGKIRKLVEQLGGGECTSTAVNLGVDDTAGRLRRQAGRGRKQATR